MFLKSIEFTNFRNLGNLRHDFKRNLSILVGQNAAGKTNFLEGVRFLSFSKSFRADHDQDLILWQKDFAKVKGEVKNKEEDLQIDIALENKNRKLKKTIKIRGAIRPVSNLLGRFISVLFSPEDLFLVQGAPSLRRRYLDIILGQINPHYYHCLLELKKVLASRNKLLLEIREGRADRRELSFWDTKLVQCGVFIIRKRKELLDFINSKIKDFYSAIAGDSSRSSHTMLQGHESDAGAPPLSRSNILQLRYAPDIEFENVNGIEENFQKELAIRKEEELQKARTLCGPHLDDFVFYLSSKRLACFGSRGELRSAILALKMAELDFLEAQLSERPILLLDDIFSELDALRRGHLFSLVQKQQTIVTATELDFLSSEFRERAETLEIKNYRE